jgi:glycine/D-amino acid oxidase-like deaminating enzyme
VRPGAMVDGIETRGGTVRGVRLTEGETVAADRVVLAAGLRQPGHPHAFWHRARLASSGRSALA